MHGFVLEDREGGIRALEQRMTGPIEVGVLEGIQHLTVGFGGKVLDEIAGGPPSSRITKMAGRVPLGLMRIDASSEQRFKADVDARPAQTALHERVEAEGRQMALVKDDRMAQRDRAAVVRLFADQVEERLRPRAVAHIPVGEGLASERRHGRRSQHNGGRIGQPI